MSTGALRLRAHRLTEAPSSGLDVAGGPDFMSDPNRHCAPGRLYALGLDEDIFYSPITADKQQAKALCGGCPVAEACLGFALGRSERFGIWGGIDMEDEGRSIPKPVQVATQRPAEPTRAEKTAALQSRVRELWEREQPDSVIALKLGIAQGSVTNIRKQLGLAGLYGPGGRRIRQAVDA